MPKYLRHAQSTFLGKLLFLRDTRAQFANVYIEAHSSKLFQNCNKNVEQMGRKRGHGGQFSRLNQPSVKRKKETANGNVENVATSSVRVELKNLSSEEKIDKLERDCERAGLKRTITNSTTKYRLVLAQVE